MQPIAKRSPATEPKSGVRTYESYKLEPPRAADAIPANQCLRCGMIGTHATPAECIAALRDRLSRFE